MSRRRRTPAGRSATNWRRRRGAERKYDRGVDLRATQRPLKDRYRAEPAAARITLRARGSETASAAACSVDIGRAVYEAQAHTGVGGAGTAPCSGDLLLGA